MSASLAGLRILVPRSGAAAARAKAAILRRGGEPVGLPLIATVPPSDEAALRAALAEWNADRYDWLAVTSAAGAEAVGGAGARPSTQGRVAAVGPATVAALEARGLAVTLSPEHEYTGAALGAELARACGDPEPGRARHVLLAVAEGAGNDLEDAVRAAGHRVTRVSAYRTVPAPRDPERERAIAAGGADVILVTSGSVARELADRFGGPPSGSLLVAIGPPTARALAELGMPADLVAARHTVEGMLDELERALDRPDGQPERLGRAGPSIPSRSTSPTSSTNSASPPPIPHTTHTYPSQPTGETA